jgi:DNA-binding XRE family transcriptional regulator
LSAAENLRAWRINRGLGPDEAAKAIGVSRDTLVRAESGAAVPHPRNAFKIAQFYGVQVTDLWPVTDEQVPA